MKVCSKCGVEMEERFNRFGQIEILCVTCAAEEPTVGETERKDWKPWLPGGQPYPAPKSTVRA